MNRFIQSAWACIGAILLIALGAASSYGQSSTQDTVEMIHSQNGPYSCCYDLIVSNRQTNGTRISEFRLRIISGGARFINGAAESPFGWTIFQLPTQVTWGSTGVGNDIEPGERLGGFRVCLRDTGVFRMVWETRDADSVITIDTMVLACRRGDCDEAFFTLIPSSSRCVVDVDVSAGNPFGQIVNDFHLHMLTPGASFRTTPQPLPAGWTRNRARFDTIAFFSPNNGLRGNQIAEGFRFEFDAPNDSIVRVEWWTTNFGDPLCRDTVTFRCGLLVPDTVISRRQGSGDTCCLDLRLKNTHQPASPLDGFAIKVTTPGAKIISESAPAGWTRSMLSAAGDSLAYSFTADAMNGLRTGDTALFRGICFDNMNASSDSIRYRWESYRRGVQVSSGTGFLICLRPLTGCDSVGARVDSTFPATERCISLTLANRNSRNAAITRFVARISNPGVRRSIRSASAPAGWLVQSFGGDSVVWIGGPMQSGRSLAPFTFCVSLSDTGSRDPLSIAWSTSNSLGPICSDTLRVNANLTIDCDSVSVQEIGAPNASNCCYRISFANRNSGNRTIDRFRLEMVGQNTIFSSGEAPSPWAVSSTTFPSFSIDYTGSTVAPGASSPEFTFCIDASLISARPITIPIIWRSFVGNQMVCFDTLALICTGSGQVTCDTIPLISQRDSAGVGCIYSFRLVNAHQPAGAVNGVRFRITSGTGVFGDAAATGSAAAWSTIDRQRQSVLFRGGTLPAGSSAEAFMLRIDSTSSGSIQLEASSMLDDQVICTNVHTVQCTVAGVELSLAPSGIRLSENRPNPFSGVTEIAYDLVRAADVSIVIRDERGEEVRRITRGREDGGEHRFLLDVSELPSGIYFYTLEAGGEMVTRRMVLVK